MASLDVRLRQALRDELDRHVRSRERNSEPAPAVILAQQHHGCALGPGDLGEKLGLADKGLAGAHDGVLVHRGGDQRIYLMPQAPFGPIPDPGHGGERGWRSPGRQLVRQRLGQRLANEDSAGAVLVGVGLDRKLQLELLVKFENAVSVPDQKVARIVSREFACECFKRDLRADASDVAERDADTAGVTRFHRYKRYTGRSRLAMRHDATMQPCHLVTHVAFPSARSSARRSSSSAAKSTHPSAPSVPCPSGPSRSDRGRRSGV